MTTILIGNNIVNVAAAAIATAVTISIFGNIGVGIATGVVVIILLVFGEIGPKIYATRHTEHLALGVSKPIFYLSKVFSPIIWGIEKITGRFGTAAAMGEAMVTEEEIKEWIDVGKEEGTIEKEEREMLFSVLEFSDTLTREIMTPRVDVALIKLATDPSAKKYIVGSGVYNMKMERAFVEDEVKDAAQLIESRGTDAFRVPGSYLSSLSSP